MKKSVRKMTEKQERVQKTIERMKRVRIQDNVSLRETIKAKLDWAIAEKQVGLDTIKRIQDQCLKLEGIIIAFKELLEESSKKEE